MCISLIRSKCCERSGYGSHSNEAAKISDGTDRLREYRTALIPAAVTDKIDMREAV